jgi:hypothetical protein
MAAKRTVRQEQVDVVQREEEKIERHSQTCVKQKKVAGNFI